MTGDQYLTGTPDPFPMGRDQRWGLAASKRGSGALGTLQGGDIWWHSPEPHLVLAPWHSRVWFPRLPACVGAVMLGGSLVEVGVGEATGHVLIPSTSLVSAVGSPISSGLSSCWMTFWSHSSSPLRVSAGRKAR